MYIKKVLSITICLILLIIISNIPKIFFDSKYTKLPEVKLKEIKDSKLFAIMISNENGDEYEEYKGENWPKGYIYRKSVCLDNNGNLLNNLLEYDDATNTIMLETSQTVYCTLYFDKLMNGEGTEDVPYEIQYIEDLLNLSIEINNNSYPKNSYYKLNRDLDFLQEDSYKNYTTKKYGDLNGNDKKEDLLTELTTEKGWKPIGINYNISFSGSFDGNKKTIKNLYIKDTTETADYIGLFGYGNHFTIHDLTIEGSINNVNDIVGLFGGANYGTFDNIKTNLNIINNNGQGTAGGLIGNAYQIININNSSNFGKIENCNHIGGLIGYYGNNSLDTILSISNSYNNGELFNNNGSYLGGLIGRINNINAEVIIDNCYNKNNVNSLRAENSNSNTFTGGLIGLTNGKVKIINSYNSGLIKNEYADGNSYSNNVCNGGLVGENNNNSLIIKDSHNEGVINGGGRVGGLVGYNYPSASLIIDRSYNLNNVISDMQTTGTDSVGGLIGYNGSESHAIIINSYNIALINSTEDASGLIGNTNYGATSIILNSFNSGDIISTNDAANGIARARNTNIPTLKLNNVYNIGVLSGTVNYGIGYIGNNAEYNILNSYYDKTLSSSNHSGIGEGLDKNKDMLGQTMLNKLNENTLSVNLNEYGISTTEYKLSNWKLGSDNYPMLDLK